MRYLSNKPNLRIFLIGGSFGLALFLILVWLASRPEEGVELPLISVLFPWFHLNLDDRFLELLCNILNRPNLCRGLGLDGGPLAWVEYIWAYVSPFIFYGIFFVIIRQLKRLVSYLLTKESSIEQA